MVEITVDSLITAKPAIMRAIIGSLKERGEITTKCILPEDRAQCRQCGAFCYWCDCDCQTSQTWEEVK